MARSMYVRRPRAPWIALLAVVLAASTAGCSLERSGYQFVRSRSTGTYMKVPNEWTVYDPKEIDRFFAENNPDAPRSEFSFISVFDAKPEADLDFDVTTTDPVGVLRVRDLSSAERDSVSFATARQELYESLNDGIQSGAFPVRKATEVTQDAATGQRIVFSTTDAETDLVSTIDQTTLIDRDKNRIYLLVIGCQSACYDKHRKQIDTVVTSLTIKEP